jgi:hypothetical protein
MLDRILCRSVARQEESVRECRLNLRNESCDMLCKRMVV